jgi:hypothetical protein
MDPGNYPEEVRLDGVSAAATANTAGQVQAALQVFAAKQATNAAASAAAVLLQTLVPPSAPGPAHLGQHVDTRA